MSRKLILSLAAVATLASTAILTGQADAMVLRGSGGNPGHPGHPGHPVGYPHFPHHIHFHYAHDRLYVRPVGYAVRAVEPGPCTCLTKNYTPEGMVVFQDLCTKEMASAPVDGSTDHAEIENQPNNFAGRTYQDYLKDNPKDKEPQKN